MPSKIKKNNLKAGDVCIVKFHPSFGSELKKYRPAVVVSHKTQNIDPRFILIAPLTTSTKNLNKKHELLIKKGKGLEENSVLLCWHLWTIDTSRVVSKIGQLTTKETLKMKRKVQRLFD